MESGQTHRPQSWQQKESMNTGLINAPEVHYDESSLESTSKSHGVSYVNNALEAGQQYRQPSPTKHRKLWLLSAVATVLVLLALGLGIGLHFRSDSTSMSATSPQSVTATTALVSTTSSSLSGSSSSTSTTTSTMPTTSPVTSGSTGIAADDCRTRGTNEYITNNNPTTFIFDCGADYPPNGPTYSGNGTVHDLGYLITYTFEDCMENCVLYNKQQSTTTPCLAVVYAVNLTYSIAKDSANCWFKSARGRPYYGNAIELDNSAYVDSR